MTLLMVPFPPSESRAKLVVGQAAPPHRSKKFPRVSRVSPEQRAYPVTGMQDGADWTSASPAVEPGSPYSAKVTSVLLDNKLRYALCIVCPLGHALHGDH